MGAGQKSVREGRRRWIDNNMEQHLQTRREWRAKNKDRLAIKREPIDVCEILAQHHEDMKDDPERLSTEFIKNIVGVDCKR